MLRATDERYPNQVFTMGPRGAYATVEWLAKIFTYTDTKIGQKRATWLRKREFDACIQVSVGDLDLALEDEGLLVEIMAALEKTFGAWLFLRWNRRLCAPANEKVPAYFS